jgi:hypothetical protein
MLYIVFSIPSVQKRAAVFALGRLQPRLDTEMGLAGIRIRLNSVELRGLYVTDHQQDTLLYVGRLAVQISTRDLFSNNLSVSRLRLEDFTANVNRETPDAPFNFQFLIDAFTNEQDTTLLEEPSLPWHIVVNDLILENGTLRYNILSEPTTPGRFNAKHIDIHDFNFRARVDFRNPQDMNFDIVMMSLEEKKSGFRLNDFSGRVIGMGNLLSSNTVNISVNSSFFSLTDVRFNTATQEFSLSLESETDPQDISIFAPGLAHLDNHISFSISAYGQLPEVSLSRLNLAYGEGTNIDLSAFVANVGEVESSDLSVIINNLSVSPEDLQAFIRIGAEDFESPEQLLALGDIHLQLSAEGRMNNFHYNGTIQMEQGDVTLSGIGSFENGFERLTFDGPVSVHDIQVANIIGGAVDVDNATLYTNAKVLIIRDEPVSITADGHIVSVLYNDFLYENLHFAGHLSTDSIGTNITANINTDTDFNSFDLNTELAFGSEMTFVVNGTVERLDLRPLMMRENWQMPALATHIDLNMSGETIDDMVGTMVLNNTSLTDNHFIYNPGPIFLQAFADEGNGRRIQVMTSFLEGTIEGDYYFTTIGNELIHHVLRPHLPSVITESQAHQSASARNNFSFNISLRNTEDLSFAFGLPVYNVEVANISGSVDMDGNEPVTVTANLPRLMFGTNDIRGTRIDLQTTSQAGINLNVNTYLSQERGFINARLATDAANDSINNRIGFEMRNPTAVSNGELRVSAGFLRTFQDEFMSNIRLHPATILFNDRNIVFNEATIAQRPERIEVRNFGLYDDGMLLFGIEGVASKNATDSVRLFFQNTELLNILSAFNVHNFTGAINGGIYINQALDNPMIRTENLRIENIAAHNDTIGTLIVNGDWNNVNFGLDLDAYLIDEEQRSLTIRGFVPTGDQSPYQMTVNLRIQEFDLFTILPFATDIFSELSGSLNSDINITGSISEPIVEGWVGIENGVMRVAYTDVTYYVSDRIEIRRDIVGLNNLVIRDQNGNTATLNVTLSHTNFGRMVYTANISLNDFMLLNNERRTDLMTYGNLRLSGNLNITGSPSGIFGEGSLRTSSRSRVTVAIPRIATAEEYGNVIFINVPQPADTPEFLWRHTDNLNAAGRNRLPVVMQVSLHLNQLLEAGVLLDPVSGNALEVRGDGDLNVRFDSRASTPVTLFGEYVIQDGTFHFNVLQNIRRDFNIRQGSSLTMIGNPLSTRFNIFAYYAIRADLATLSPAAFSRMSNTRVRTNALLEISGSVESLDLNPHIEVPDVSSDTQQRVSSFLTPDTKMQQFIHLVALGSFWPADGSLNFFGASNAPTQFAALALSQVLDAMFTNVLSDNWRIGTTLQPTDGTLAGTRVGVDVSGRLLNDRLHISTNLSYSEESQFAHHQQFMGEFEVEYELNSWFRLRVYNRANDRFYRRAPTTQGAGVVVTREARDFENLFRFRFRRREGE